MSIFNFFKRKSSKKREDSREQYAPETLRIMAELECTFEYRPKPNVELLYGLDGKLKLATITGELPQYDNKKKIFKFQHCPDGLHWRTVIGVSEGHIVYSDEQQNTLATCMFLANMMQHVKNIIVLSNAHKWRVGIDLGCDGFTTCFSGYLDGRPLFDKDFNDLGRITCHLEDYKY